MKIERKVINEKDNVVQVTTSDQRFYQIGDTFVPSVTWICSFYPKGIQYYKWLADKGWDEAEAIKVDAGIYGSKVHQAIEMLLNGHTLKMDDSFLNTETGEQEEVTVKEWEAIISFADWFHEAKPKVIAVETVVYNELYAGTIDLICEIDGETWIIDFKTSSNVWPSHELQISAYKHAYAVDKMGILQIGYSRNKRGWKLTQIDDKYHLFEAAYEIWKAECLGVKPLQKDYPLTITLEGEVITHE